MNGLTQAAAGRCVCWEGGSRPAQVTKDGHDSPAPRWTSRRGSSFGARFGLKQPNSRPPSPRDEFARAAGVARFLAINDDRELFAPDCAWVIYTDRYEGLNAAIEVQLLQRLAKLSAP